MVLEVLAGSGALGGALLRDAELLRRQRGHGFGGLSVLWHVVPFVRSCQYRTPIGSLRGHGHDLASSPAVSRRLSIAPGAFLRACPRKAETTLAGAGARAILNARNPQKLEHAADRLRAEGGFVLTAAFDLTDGAAVTEGIGRIEAEVGAIDILVNNAGMQRRAPLEQFEE
ncbi:MAG: SDR family NAD(P)-dependent oxidoreductase, partial [Burkholderiales bacterium]